MRRLFTATMLGAALAAGAAAPAGAQGPISPPSSAVIGNLQAATDPADGTVACAGCIATPYAIALGAFGTVAPISGIVTQWQANLTGPGAASLVVMTPVAGSPGTFTVRNTSAPQTVGSGPQFAEYATSQPIMQGDTIGLQSGAGGALANFTTMPFNGVATAAPPAAAGASATVTPYAGDAYLLLNATVVRAPVLTGISPSSGPANGGTTVTLTGDNFDQAAAVTFGSRNAQSFTVVSPTTIQAVAPATSTAGPVSVQVSNAAGLGVAAPSAFVYNAVCRVPNVRRKSIAAARRALQRANCSLGAIRRAPSHGRRHRARIVSQSPAAGSTGEADRPVVVTVRYTRR